jgi:hypothetical protein
MSLKKRQTKTTDKTQKTDKDKTTDSHLEQSSQLHCFHVIQNLQNLTHDDERQKATIKTGKTTLDTSFPVYRMHAILGEQDRAGKGDQPIAPAPLEAVSMASPDVSEFQRGGADSSTEASSAFFNAVSSSKPVGRSIYIYTFIYMYI